MTFDNPILFFLCGLGVFNGFIVSIYFLLFNKQKRAQHFFLGLLLLMLSVRIGKSVYVTFTEKSELNRWILQIGLSACFLIGVSLFYYLKSSIENRKSIPLAWKLHFVGLLVFIVVVGSIKPYETHAAFWNTYFVWFIYFTWGTYLVASVFILRNIIKKSFTKAEKYTTAELWLIAVLIANILIFAAYLVGYFFLYLVGTITFSVVFYALLIFLLFEKNRESIFQDIPEKYGAKKIDESEASFLIQQLNSLMKEKELYKETDIKLPNIARQIHISPHKLSQLLNDNLGKSFSSFINDHRIEEAKRLLKENHKFTLEAIGFEAGFTSKSSFYSTFKKVVGQTPAEFKKQFS